MVLLIARLILAVVFIYAAWTKLSAPWPVFAVSINSYQLVPLGWLEPIARTLPWFELLLGVMLATGILLRWVAAAGTGLLGFFFVLMVRSYLIGLKIDCGCFGPGDELGPKTLLRDGVLLALSAYVAIGAFLANRKPEQLYDPARRVN